MRNVSRNCLGLQALDGTDGDGVHPVFERLFREAGLPLAILTDNGPPFVAPRGLHGLPKLSVWWIRLGIRVPGAPAEPRLSRALPQAPGQLRIWAVYLCKEEVARYDERTKQIQR